MPGFRGFNNSPRFSFFVASVPPHFKNCPWCHIQNKHILTKINGADEAKHLNALPLYCFKLSYVKKTKQKIANYDCFIYVEHSIPTVVEQELYKAQIGQLFLQLVETAITELCTRSISVTEPMQKLAVNQRYKPGEG